MNSHQINPEQVSRVIDTINAILTAKVDAAVHPDYRGLSTCKLDVTADEVIAAMAKEPQA